MKKSKGMKWVIILAMLLCMGNGLMGQTNFCWGKQFGSEKEDASFTVTSDLSGSVYIAGYTNGILSNLSNGKSDGFIIKFDSNGNILWTNQFGTTEDDQISATTTDKMGNIYVTGYTKGLLDEKKFGNEDVFVAKLDSTGAVIWKKQFGTELKEVGNGICIDNLGDIYVAGETTGLFGDSVFGKTDGFVLKLDNTGNKIYIHQFGTAKDESCRGIVLDSSKTVYVSGSTFGDLGAKNKGSEDAYVAIFNEQPMPIQIIQFGTTSTDAYVHVALDREGNIYVSGSTGGEMGGKQLGQGDSFLTKLNKKGEILWTNQFGTGYWDGIHGVVINEQISDNIIVSGCQKWPTCQGFVREIRKDGKLAGVQNFAMIEKNKGTCGQTLCLDNKGNIYHTGLTDESLFSKVQGQHDIFLLKLALNNNLTKPYISTPLTNQLATNEVQFSYTFPEGIFISDDGKTSFTYSATSGNGTPLPSWLSFNAATRTFSGVPNAIGTFDLMVIATDNSKATASCSFTLKVSQKPVSIEKMSSQTVLIYPNPTNDRIEFSLGTLSDKDASVKIFDIQGKLISSDTFHHLTKATIDLSGQPKGTYFVKLFIDGELYSKKICLE